MYTRYAVVRAYTRGHMHEFLNKKLIMQGSLQEVDTGYPNPGAPDILRVRVQDGETP